MLILDQWSILIDVRYIRVRYEDLADSTEETLQSLSSHLGLPWTQHVRKEVWSHTHAEADETKSKNYYNTFRSKNFDHDSWKAGLGASEILGIEAACKVFMDMAGYSPFTGNQ